MKDQYNNPIPADLTRLQSAFELTSPTDEQIKKLCLIDWYCFSGNQNDIFVSQSKLEEIVDGPIDSVCVEDCATDAQLHRGIKLLRIDSVLYRWNESDGFYWA